MINDVSPSAIGVLLVLYNPSSADLTHVETVASRYRGVVVDNSASRSFPDDRVGQMAYLPLGDNMGIAHAQNVGLRWLLSQEDIQYVVFFDQDSRFAMSYPQEMVGEYVRIRCAVPRLALLGPTLVDSDSQAEYKSVFHADAAAVQGFVPRRDVISSGSVVSRAVLQSVGLMIGRLFIDYVDFEWCWRAERQGYVCGQTRNMRISHSVGISRFTWMGYMVQVWSPFRYFYQYRNYVWLSTLAYTPRQWIFATGVKSLLRLVYFPFFIKNGLRCWMQMWRGLATAVCQLGRFRKEVRG